MFRKRLNDWLDSHWLYDRSDNEFSKKRQDRRIEVEIARGRLRDEFAMAAVSAIIQNKGVQTPALAAETAYAVADAMLAARELG